MPFEDKENLTDLKTFTDAVYFNDDAHFYGNVYGLETANIGITSIVNNNSNVTVQSNETITVTTNGVGIVTFSQSNIGIANTVTFERTGIVQQLTPTVMISMRGVQDFEKALRCACNAVANPR